MTRLPAILFTAACVAVSPGCRTAKVAPKAVLPMTRTLAWDWTPDGSNTWQNCCFIVRSNRIPAAWSVHRTNWPVFAVATTNRCTFTVNKAIKGALFTVQTSNKVTHGVSL